MRHWRASTGEAFAELFRGHNCYIFGVAIKPNSNGIVSGSEDGDMRPWDALNSDPIGLPLPVYRETVIAASKSRDGELVLYMSSPHHH